VAAITRSMSWTTGTLSHVYADVAPSAAATTDARIAASGSRIGRTRPSTLPTLLLGGEVARDQAATFERWGAALRVPGAIGLVVGRSLLFPPDDDVAAAVDTAVGLIPRPDRASVAASGS